MLQNKWSYITFIFICLVSIGCGRKSLPIPQKINQLFSLQDVFVYLNSDGTLTVQGKVRGAIINVQSILLELEPINENCPTCPFIPLEKFNKRSEMISLSTGHFSFTVMPAKRVMTYRWRLVGYNIISGLPEVHSPVLTITKNDVNNEIDFTEQDSK